MVDHILSTIPFGLLKSHVDPAKTQQGLERRGFDRDDKSKLEFRGHLEVLLVSESQTSVLLKTRRHNQIEETSSLSYFRYICFNFPSTFDN